MNKRTYLLALVCSLTMLQAVAGNTSAEFAIRWDPKTGGPQSAGEAFTRLTADTPERDNFRIRYAVLKEPTAGVRAILRERTRTSKQRFELTFKLRSNKPLSSTLSFTADTCPAGTAAEPPKDEVDVSFVSDSLFETAYSLSCTAESKKTAPAVPAALSAAFAPCYSTTKRLKVGDLTVEEWSLPGGRIAIEVSRSGANTDEARELFRQQVVKPLVDTYKIKPLKLSKTEMGGDCKAPI